MLFDVFQIQSVCTFCENMDSFRSKAPRFEKAGRVEVNPQLFETCVQVVEAGILWVGLNVLNKNAKAETVETVKKCQCERETLIAVSSCNCNVIVCCNQVPLCFPGCCKAGALCSHFFVAISDVKNLQPVDGTDATLTDQGLVSLRLSSFTRHRGAPVVAWKPWNHSAGGLSQQPKWQMPIGAADRITEIRVNRAGSLYQKCHYWCRTYSWCVRLCMTWRVISNWRGFGWLQLVWDVSGHTFIQFSQLPGLSHAALCGPTWAAETCPFSTSRPRAKPPSLGSRSSTRLATKLATPS